MNENLGQIAALWISNVAPSNQGMIWDDINIVGGIRHKYYDRFLDAWTLFPCKAYRITITEVDQVIDIPVQTDIDYEVEVVMYKFNGANASSLITVPDGDKAVDGFKVEVSANRLGGVLVYRVLKF